MPFFDHVGPDPDAYGAAVKEDVRLTQLGARGGRTTFRCGDAFGWVDLTPGVPDADSRVALDTRTDLASIPSFLWGLIASYGRHTMPAILHDVRCDAAHAAARDQGGAAHSAYLRRRADQQFRRTLKVHADQGLVTRYVMWCAVRLFGFTPLGVAVAVGVLASMLHFSGEVFVDVSALLGSVTIWPWLSWLDIVPQGVAWVLAWLAEVLAPDAVYRVVVALAAGATLVALLVRSVERTSADAPRRLSAPALASLVGAVVVGVLSAPPILPLVVVTLVTRYVLFLLDWGAHWLEVGWARALRVVDRVTPPRVSVPESAMTPGDRPRLPSPFPAP